MNYLNRISLGGLRAVEAAARLGSQKAAAAELGVTVGAVNQQILRCEDALGKKLFTKSGRSLALTPLGNEVVPMLSRGIAELASAVRHIENVDRTSLTISVAPVFASRWLVWRLGKFHALHPNIRIRVDAEVARIDPNTNDIDACIRVGFGHWPNVKADWLADQEVFPVCSPEIAKGISKISDVLSVPVISEPHPMFGWDVWLGLHGQKASDLQQGPVYSDASLCLDAAIASQGVFLAWHTLAQDSVDAGRLVAPFPLRVRTGISYWFITARDRQLSGSLKAFHRWLKEELAQSDGTPQAERCG
jgi:LysR family transcriptional regulator, glycine cleavage system transcriptional activator